MHKRPVRRNNKCQVGPPNQTSKQHLPHLICQLELGSQLLGGVHSHEGRNVFLALQTLLNWPLIVSWSRTELYPHVLSKLCLADVDLPRSVNKLQQQNQHDQPGVTPDIAEDYFGEVTDKSAAAARAATDPSLPTKAQRPKGVGADSKTEKAGNGSSTSAAPAAAASEQEKEATLKAKVNTSAGATAATSARRAAPPTAAVVRGGAAAAAPPASRNGTGADLAQDDDEVGYQEVVLEDRENEEGEAPAVAAGGESTTQQKVRDAPSGKAGAALAGKEGAAGGGKYSAGGPLVGGADAGKAEELMLEDVEGAAEERRAAAGDEEATAAPGTAGDGEGIGDLDELDDPDPEGQQQAAVGQVSQNEGEAKETEQASWKDGEPEETEQPPVVLADEDRQYIHKLTR